MNPGDKVTYVPKYGPKEKGIVKALRLGDGLVRVVFKCNNDWEHYEDYTSALTDINDLQPGWPSDPNENG